MGLLVTYEAPTSRRFSSLQTLLQYAREEKFSHLMARVSLAQSDSIGDLEEANFRAFGSLLTFQKEISTENNQNSQPQRMAAGDLPETQDWISRLFRNSYMYKDPFYDPWQVNELHRAWLANLFKDPQSTILVTRDPRQNRVTGISTVRRALDHFRIDLFGVHPDYHRQGLSQSLLLQSSSYVNRTGERLPLIISTQGENTDAVNAYIQFGFRLSKSELTLCLSL